jgi:molybdopterin synthase catalytic subunit
MLFITEGSPDTAALTAWLQQDGRNGAANVFYGFVRNHHQGKTVVALEYEAFIPLAEAEMHRIETEASQQWPGATFFAKHATGKLAPGQLVVIAAAASPHRAASFEACRYLIEEMKKRVPIWKKEFYEDGTGWVGAFEEQSILKPETK